jgi:glycosyltransferase involved in cell wall biosynthesis
MVIGIDASRANKQYRSGTEWYSYYLIKEIAKLDSKNEYILYTDCAIRPDLSDLSSDEDNHRPPEFDQQGFQVIKSPHNNFKAKILDWPFKFLWTQGRLSLEMIFNKPDVLFVPSHTLPIIHPKKSVVTIHDVGFERDHSIYKTQPLGPGKGRSRSILNFFVKLVTAGRFSANTLDYLSWSTIYGLRKAAKVITVSEFSAQEIRDVYKTVLKPKTFDKIIPIHNGYNDDIFKTGLDVAKIASTLHKHELEQPYVFYLGRIERKKNIPRLIEAFAHVVKRNPKIKLVLTGAASYGFDEVKFMISDFGLDEHVIKTGWVDEEDLPYLYAGSEMFVFPSLYEGFGIPLIQAMACGVPVCCSNAPAITEVVDGAGLQFDSLDANDMASKMNQILERKETREELIKKGLRQAKKFSWQLSARKTLEVLTNL